MRQARCDKRLWGSLAIAVAVGGWSAGARGEERTGNLPDTGAASPAQLVDQALRSELKGPTDTRKQLLDEALRLDPDFAPARWQSGFVRWDDQWLGVDQAPEQAGNSPQLAAYRKLRDELIDTADNQREMARWCRRNKLTSEEKIHWSRVLEFEQNDPEALAALGLQWHAGRLLTHAQIEQEKKQSGEQLRATHAWQPKLARWRAAIEHGTAKESAEAQQGIRELKDPAVLPALEALFAHDGDGPKVIELNGLLIETAGRFAQPAATQILLRRALIPNSPQVRAMAADALKKRPMQDYVPLLIAALPGSISSEFRIFVGPNGTVTHEHEIFINGRKANLSMSYDSTISPGDAMSAMFTTPVALARETRSAAHIESRARALRARSEWIRDRIQFVLQRTTGFAQTDDPQLWQKQYNDYNGWYTPAETKPTYNVAATSIVATLSLPFFTGPHSCFPAGTPVLTILGPRAIETIKLGDRVLTQDIATGELAYKPVERTTLRPETPLVKITLGSESLLATQGHPIWVVGEGWHTAKHLTPGTFVHTLDGAALVDDVADARATEVYNLVVSEAHDYFVGNARLLVHDNSPLEPAPLACPGLPLEAR